MGKTQLLIMKQVRIFTYIVGIIQIIGGGLLLYGLFKYSANPQYDLFKLILITLPFILLSVVAGINILKTKTAKGLYLSFINYFLQIVQFKIVGFYFFYSIGPYLGVGFVKNANQELSFWWEASEFIFINITRFVNDKIGYFVSFNFVAILFIIILLLELNNRKTR